MNGGHNSLDCIFCLRAATVNAGNRIRQRRLEAQSLTDRLQFECMFHGLPPV